MKSIGRSSYWLSFELLSDLLCVSAYQVISHIELAVEILLPCNTEWLYFLAQCHNARSVLFLTALQKVKCPHRLSNTMSVKGYAAIWCVQHDAKNRVLHLKILFSCLWKKHGDLRLLAEKPWKSYACSWLILLDIRHCVCLNCTTYWSHRVPTVSSCYPSGSVVVPLHACILNSETKWHCNC